MMNIYIERERIGIHGGVGGYSTHPAALANSRSTKLEACKVDLFIYI